MRTIRYRRLTATVGLILGLALAACAPNIAPDAQPAYRQLQAVRIVNDVSSAAIAANRAGTLSDPDTAQVLTVTWQVRDFIERNPATTTQRIIAAVQEGRDALPADVRGRVDRYLAAGIAALEELLK